MCPYGAPLWAAPFNKIVTLWSRLWALGCTKCGDVDLSCIKKNYSIKMTMDFYFDFLTVKKNAVTRKVTRDVLFLFLLFHLIDSVFKFIKNCSIPKY